MASLLIILPYKAASTDSDLNNEEWINKATVFKVYRERTGVSTTIRTLDEINIIESGEDEQEKIKRFIYDWARDKFADNPTEFLGVMLVGNPSIFPVRRILRGHTPDGDPYYGAGGVLFNSCYRLDVCDAYYANLWDPEDPTQSFSTWNEGGSTSYYGELYYSNFRSTDQNSLHPQVAVGRVLCDKVDEFFVYLQKVVQYEAVAATHLSKDQVLLISSNLFDQTIAKNNSLKEELGTPFEVSHLKRQTRKETLGNFTFTYVDFVLESPEGETESTDTPDSFIINYFETQQPRLVHYFAHGNHNIWDCFDFGLSDAAVLGNEELPAIVFASSCETGQFSTFWFGSALPTSPYSGNNLYCMAEAFQITAQKGGAVIYIGAFTGTRPETYYLSLPFFQSIRDGEEFAGRAWMSALESYIGKYNLDKLEGSEREHDWFWPDPDTDYYYPANPLPSRFIQAYTLHFFGDPTLHLNGITEVEEVGRPTTTISMRRWVNKEDLTRYRWSGTPYIHEINLTARDLDGLGIIDTQYRYRISSATDWTEWQSGNHFSIPIELEGMERQVSQIEFRSTNFQMVKEEDQSATFEYDFTLPECLVEINGSILTIIPDSVIEEVDRVRILARDNGSQPRFIHYIINDGISTAGSGTGISIGLNHCVPNTTTITFCAEDYAGNIGESKSIIVKPSFDSINCLSSLSAIMRGRIEDRITSLSDTVFLEELAAAIDWPIPDSGKGVLFEFAGPITSVNQALQWQRIGTAFHHQSQNRFQALWDTRSFNVKNGFFWVRAVAEKANISTKSIQLPIPKTPKGKLMFISNYRLKEDYHLSVKTQTVSLKPGDKVKLEVNIRNLRLGNLNNMRIGLITDRYLWIEDKDIDFLKSFQYFKEGEQWKVTFLLTLDHKTTNLDDFKIGAFVQSEEIALLTGNTETITILPKNISVKGAVRDHKGRPLRAVVQLRQNNHTWKKRTRKKGTFHFRKVPAGPYALSVVKDPKGYRQAIPKAKVYSFAAKGNDIQHNFTFVPTHNDKPIINPLLSWEKAIDFRLFYGLTSSEKYGSPITKMELGVEDKLISKWWHPEQGWIKGENWFAPSQFGNLSEFLKKKEDTGFLKIPILDHQQEYQKLSKWNDRFGTNRDVKVWTFLFGQAPVFSDGWKVLHIRTWNEAGFYSQTQQYNTRLHVDFQIDPISKENPFSFQFFDRTEGVVLSQRWEFGDGTIGRGSQVKHTYKKAGKYQVTLHILSPYLDDSLTKTVIVGLEQQDIM